MAVLKTKPNHYIRHTPLKIISDGTPRNTRVETEDGTVIDGVTAISINMAVDSITEVTFTLKNVPINIVAKEYLLEKEKDVSYEEPTISKNKLVNGTWR